MSASTQSAIDLSGIECWRDKVRHYYVGQTDVIAADTVSIERVVEPSNKFVALTEDRNSRKELGKKYLKLRPPIR